MVRGVAASIQSIFSRTPGMNFSSPRDGFLYQALFFALVFLVGKLLPVGVQAIDRGDDRIAVRTGPGVRIIDRIGAAGRVEAGQFAAVEAGAFRCEDQVPYVRDALALADAEVNLARARIDAHGPRRGGVIRGQVFLADKPKQRVLEVGVGEDGLGADDAAALRDDARPRLFARPVPRSAPAR